MPGRRQSGKRVLIVEDDEAIRDALTLILQDEGYQVHGAAHGREALDWLRGTDPPSLILLDLMMPVMDGSAFCAEQKRDPLLSGIPVIVFSADGNVQQKALALGAVAFLQKPIELDSLLDMVRRYS